MRAVGSRRSGVLTATRGLLLAVVSLAVASACFSLALDDGQYQCGPGGACPGGLVCAADGYCYHPGRGPADADAGAVDRPAGDTGTDVAGDELVPGPDAPVPPGPDAPVPPDADAGGLDVARDLVDAPGPDLAGDVAFDGPCDGCPPPATCAEALARSPDAPSGVYTLSPTPGVVVDVFCEMTRFGGGWARVVDFDASRDPCPGDWVRLASPAACHRDLPEGGVRTATFPAPYAYSEVMGYVRAYQGGTTDSFIGDSVNEIYVDGISISRIRANRQREGREHVWTYAVSWSDDDNLENSVCPCLGGVGAPAFVGEHFYCESGTRGRPAGGTWYVDDPLFDAAGDETDCNGGGDPSYFVRSFGDAVTGVLEVRLMADQATSNEDVGVYRIELYVR